MWGADVRFWYCGVEQRKTALRRVEMELDEADEMVRTSPNTYLTLVPRSSQTLPLITGLPDGNRTPGDAPVH